MNHYAMTKWRSDRRINSRFIWLASHEAVETLIRKRSTDLQWESGFFRIDEKSLPIDDVRTANRGLVNILNSYRGDVARALGSADSNRTRSMGHLIAFEYFSGMIAKNRDEQLLGALRALVRDEIIPRDVRRRRYRNAKRQASNRRQIEDLLKVCNTSNEDQQDLVDISLTATSSIDEAAEILRRLVLSTVGFLGSAVEWLLIDSTQYSTNSPSEWFVQESLRFHSPAWRLTRSSANSSQINGLSYSANDVFLLNIFSANRDENVWNGGDLFMPDRWSSAAATNATLVFGKGVRSCPAQKAAVKFLEEVYDYTRNTFDIKFRKNPMSRGLVGTISAPPAGLLSLSARG